MIKSLMGWTAVVLFAVLAGLGSAVGGWLGKGLWVAAGAVGVVGAINVLSYE